MKYGHGYGKEDKIMDKIHTSIDIVKTGEVLKKLIGESGYSIRELSDILGLSCVQPLYRWTNGKTLPTLDNLYILSVLLDVHMEDMLVPCKEIGADKGV